MISSVGSYDVTPLSADKSNSALVAIGWPICRLVPWPMISSGCSLAIAARTTCSTSLASRTFRVSTALRLSVAVIVRHRVGAKRRPMTGSDGRSSNHKRRGQALTARLTGYPAFAGYDDGKLGESHPQNLGIS